MICQHDHDYAEGNVYVRISHVLSDKEADDYFDEIKKVIKTVEFDETDLLSDKEVEKIKKAKLEQILEACSGFVEDMNQQLDDAANNIDSAISKATTVEDIEEIKEALEYIKDVGYYGEKLTEWNNQVGELEKRILGNETAEVENDQPSNQGNTSGSSNSSNSSSASENSNTSSNTGSSNSGSSMTVSQQNALQSAKNYLRYLAFSREGLIGQLEYEGYSHEDAVYAVDHVGTDWNEQALKLAKNYLNSQAFSYEGLIHQLEYEKYTHEQAVYGVDRCGADWFEQAKRKGASYLQIMAYSKEGLINQLEYEGFTHEQAVYGAEANGL